MSDAMGDRLLVRELVENWVVWRDSGDWERFRTCWHDDGIMMATWFQGPADEFIRVTQAGWARGVSILHFLGGSSIEVAGDRAVSQTKMTISQRGPVHGQARDVVCDVVCTGRFYDFVERRDGRWAIVLRQPIYENDRIDPVDPAAALALDQARLATLPSGYRHLAYIQLGMGYDVKLDLPQLAGPEVDDLRHNACMTQNGHQEALESGWATSVNNGFGQAPTRQCSVRITVVVVGVVLRRAICVREPAHRRGRDFAHVA
jgi:hypothetical protein